MVGLIWVRRLKVSQDALTGIAELSNIAAAAGAGEVGRPGHVRRPAARTARAITGQLAGGGDVVILPGEKIYSPPRMRHAGNPSDMREQTCGLGLLLSPSTCRPMGPQSGQGGGGTVTTGGLWEPALREWYGPATGVVRAVRKYRPNRRGRIKLARWLRVALLRLMACAAAVLATVLAGVPSITEGANRSLITAIPLAWACFLWRGSLIKVVLEPGALVVFRVWSCVVVPCTAVKRLGEDPNTLRSLLVLETEQGDQVDFGWFTGSLWDFLYDFTEVCTDAMRFHIRTERQPLPRGVPARLDRRYNWSLVADSLALATVACLGAALYSAVR